MRSWVGRGVSRENQTQWEAPSRVRPQVRPRWTGRQLSYAAHCENRALLPPLGRMKSYLIEYANKNPTEKHCILRRGLEEETITSRRRLRAPCAWLQLTPGPEGVRDPGGLESLFGDLDFTAMR